jgi:outer membrane protein
MILTKPVRLGAVLALALLYSGGAQAQSLTQALALAYESSTDLASAYLDVRSAREGIRSAEGGLLPSIGATASVDHTWTFPSGQQSEGFNDRIGLSYNQTIFDNFETDAAIMRASASYQAAIYSAQNTEQNVLLGAAESYVDVFTARRIVDIRQENIGFVRAQVQSARDRLELGEGTRLDVAQADASLAQAQASYQSALNNLRVAEATFIRRIGRQPSGLSINYSFGSLMPASVEGAINVASGQHPALLASQSQIAAAQYQAEETRAGFGPSLSLSGSAGLGGFTSGGSVAGSASVGLSLQVPIYTPARSPAIEQANIGRMQADVGAFATRDQVIEAARQAWAGLNSATAQIESATAAVAASRLALQAVTDQNEVGQATTLDVLDARASLLSVEESLVSAQAQRVIAAFSLIASTGALSAQNLGLPVQIRGVDGVIAAPAVAPAPGQQPTKDSWAGFR